MSQSKVRHDKNRGLRQEKTVYGSRYIVIREDKDFIYAKHPTKSRPIRRIAK